MLMRSISVGSAEATAQATEWRTILACSFSRSPSGTSFESQIPRMCLSGCRTTAAATTGPARHPRPTSPTPATSANPRRRRAFSRVRIAGIRMRASLGSRSALTVGAPALFHACRLALQIAEEVQLAAADFGRAHDLDLLNRRRMKRENALDALAKRYLPHG